MDPIYLAGPIDGRRAYTDPISNTVTHTFVNPLALQDSLGKGDLDFKYLNVLMHETTHYSCFLSPVGQSLASLMAAHTANTIGLFEDEETVQGPARSAVLGDVLPIYFIPLLEGLALFAEFDARPGASPVASTTSSLAFRLFCAGSFRSEIERLAEPIDPYAFLAMRLDQHRMSSESFDRKMSLLKQPLSAEDGYLIGYLWVKSLWCVLSGRCRKLLDTDLFLSFIISYFFDDYRLAMLLFSWQTALTPKNYSRDDPENVVKAIEHYIFADRLEQLVTNCAVYVDEWETYASRVAPGEIFCDVKHHGHPNYFNYSDKAEDSIRESMAYGSIRSMHHKWPTYFSGRHILRLFVSPADIEIRENGSFKASCKSPDLHIEGGVLDCARPLLGKRVTGKGSVEAIMLTNDGKVVLCFFLGHELIATLDLPSEEFNEPTTAAACDNLCSYLALEAASVQIEEERQFRNASQADRFARKLRARAKENSYEFYSNLALGSDAGVPPSNQVLGSLNTGGLLNLIADHQGHSLWLIRLSLCVGGRAMTFVEAGRHWKVDPQEISDWVVKLNTVISERCGKQAFSADERSIRLCQF